jgi:hypothetical protein
VPALDIAAEERLFPVCLRVWLIVGASKSEIGYFDGTDPRCALCEATNMTLLSSESSPYYDVMGHVVTSCSCASRCSCMSLASPQEITTLEIEIFAELLLQKLRMKSLF